MFTESLLSNWLSLPSSRSLCSCFGGPRFKYWLERDCFYGRFLWFLTESLTKCQHRLFFTCFLPHSLAFTVHMPSLHMTIYSVSYWKSWINM
jgi:hypothetical protein